MQIIFIEGLRRVNLINQDFKLFWQFVLLIAGLKPKFSCFECKVAYYEYNGFIIAAYADRIILFWREAHIQYNLIIIP